MTKAFSDMLFLFAKGTKGEKVTDMSGIDLDGAKSAAARQSIWPTVYFAANEVNFDVLNAAMKKARRQAIIYEIIKKAEAAGIPCCYLKGEILDDMYADPGLRLTADTDILISPKNERKIKKILRENGFYIHERQKTSNELKCMHAAAGLLEIHTALETKQMSEIWFNNKTNPAEPFRKHISKAGTAYTTLSETDGLIFVFLHFVKHFISKAANVKMLMDVLLYMETYQESINWAKFNALTDELGFGKIVKTLKYAGNKYLGFNFAVDGFQNIETTAEQLLNDIETVTSGHNGFHGEYTKIRYNKFKNGNYRAYEFKTNLLNFKNRYFPALPVLYPNYPYLIKRPYLKPYAWFIRAVKFILKTNAREEKLLKTDGESHRKLIKDLEMY
jgi:hypothetical protein